jgi:hypothetical protein
MARSYTKKGKVMEKPETESCKTATGAIQRDRSNEPKYSLFKFFLSKQKALTPRNYALAALDTMEAISFLDAVICSSITRENVDSIFPPPPPEAVAAQEFLQGDGRAPMQIAPVVEPSSDPFTQLNQSAQTLSILQALQQAGMVFPQPQKPMPGVPMADTRDKKASSNGQIVGGRWVPSA